MIKMKRITSLLLVMVMALSMVGCSKKDGKEEQKNFDAFLKNDFVNTMESDYLSMHVFLENPKEFGVDASKADVTISELISDKSFKETKQNLKKTKEAFEEFDRDLLTKDQKDSYDIYAFMLDLSTESNVKKFDYTGSLLNSMTGIHTQLPTLFADFVIRNEQDVKDVITLMKSVQPYMDSVLKYTKKQEDKGTLMIDIKNVTEYCENLLKEKENSGVLVGLYDSIDKLQLGEALTTTYKQQVKDAFDGSFIPAYEDTVKTLKELDPSKNNTKGLSYLKDGKEYYEILFREAISSDKSIKETKADLSDLINSSLLEAQSIVRKNESVYEEYVNDTTKTKYTDFESMLTDLETDIEADFPSVGKLDYRIAPIGADLASGGIAAYFNLPAIDGTTPKQIRVNMLKDALDIGAMNTFSTVAHEGLPGHMYQVAYSYKNLSSPWRKIIAESSGYQEGYATYVELYSLNYLKEIPTDLIRLEQVMTVLQNSIVALCDIGIHYEGWTKSETKDFLESKGLGIADVDDFYNQLQANPTSFLSYYVGYMQFAELKTKAQSKLRDKFDDKAFHEAILKSGSAPFSVVEKNVNAYIKNTK